MKPTIAEWLKGKDILITGSTGFMGKVLVEKLLRCCDVNRLYLVIRTKRGTDPNDRLKDFIRCPLYEPLLNEKPNVFEKVTCIPGDMSELECGISKQHQAELCEKVSIVFHTAASVRFDEPLSAALKLNTRGTFELIKLAKQMPKLELFQYVSTTYCNSNLNEIVQEKVYPSHLDWKIILRLCDLEDDALDSIAYKLMGTQPNTYTLTKSLAENVVYEARKELPAVIVRPSVVTPVFHGPVPGWLSNLNGVMGVATGVSKGVLRVFKCDRNAAMDYLPADVAINGMIVAAWYKRFHSDSDEVQVFNEAYSDIVPITFQNIADLGVRIIKIYPMENYVWYPYMLFTNNTYLYHFLFFFLQLIPALFQDLLLTIARKKPMLLSLNIKIYNAAMALQRFTAKKFAFSNKKYVALTDSMTEEDKKIYDIELDAKTIDLFQTFSIAQRGVKKFIFNEKEEDMPYYKTWYWRLYYIHYGTIMIIIALAVLLITSNVSSLLWP